MIICIVFRCRIYVSGLLYVNADPIVTGRSFDSMHLIIKSMAWRTDAVFKMFFIHYNLYQVKRNIFLGVVSLANNNNRYGKYIQTWKIFQLEWYICNTSSVCKKIQAFRYYKMIIWIFYAYNFVSFKYRSRLTYCKFGWKIL